MKIAYITIEEILGPANSGGIQCSLRNIDLIKSAFGSENIFVCAITKNKDYLSRENGNMKVFFSYCNRNINSIINALKGRLVFEKKVENEIIEYLTALGCQYVFLESSKMGNLQKRLPSDLKQILFMQNIEREYTKNLLRKHLEYLIIYLPTVWNEKKAVKNAEIIIMLNKRDSVLLEKFYNRKPYLIIPITFSDSFLEQESVSPDGIAPLQLLFVGSLFSSNEHGVTWFVNEVMPYVNAELTIIGKGFERLTGKLNKDNVKTVGTVEDLSSYYYSANAVISPILFGAGMKVKTAEAFMYGKPMFATDEALEGYDVEGLGNIYRCNSQGEFINEINKFSKKTPYILYDPNIRSLFLEKYHTQGYVPVLRKMLLETINSLEGM